MPFIYGKHPAAEFVNSQPDSIKRILIANSYERHFEDIIRRAKKKRIQLEFCDWKKLEGITSRGLHQGIVIELYNVSQDIAITDILESAKQKNETPLLVILDRIQDPQNLGAILRTCLAAGVHGVIVPKMHSAKLTPSAIKASGGAAAYIQLCEVSNIVNAIEELKENNIWVIGAAADSSTVYTSVNYKQSIAFVMGSEGEGLRQLVKKHCDIAVKIPAKGAINSLNVSVACAVLLYETLRQRGTCPARSSLGGTDG